MVNKMEGDHEGQTEGKNGEPNKEDKEDERGVRKRWRKHGEEIERTIFFLEKTKGKFSQSNCRI